MSQPELSVVVPVFNERDNVAPLVAEITAALRGRLPFEIVYIDDHSRDDTLAVLQGLKATTPELRVLHHVNQSGQSTAVRTGVKHARAPWIATLMAMARTIRPISPSCWPRAMPPRRR